MADLKSLGAQSQKNVLAREPLDRINNSENVQETAKSIGQNLAYLSFFLDGYQRETHTDIIPMMTFPSFPGKVGGIIGVFIGASIALRITLKR